MTKLFKKLFIKDYQNTEDPKVRARYGVSAGILGIVSNVILFIGKLFAGLISGSVAIVADAINNLSDSMTSIITLLGFKLSNRPADKEHPFGHARFEYITALIVAFIILTIGVEVGRAGIEKIISGESTAFSIITCVILGVAILVKLCLSFIYNGLGKSINSTALIAMSKDSRNDTISTSIVLASSIVTLAFGISLDGYLAILVALFIIISAIGLIKETIDPLLGKPPEKEQVKEIEEKLKSYNGVLGIHDLVVHSYGPLQTFATVHIEVDSAVDVMISHDLLDNIERDFAKDLNVHLTCHLDPLAINDPETNQLKQGIHDIIKGLDENLNTHDFRVVQGVSHTNVIFDVVIPYGVKYTEQDIKALVENYLKTYEKTYYAVIEFDRDFNG
ncbi:MAG: cation transporter [Clostridia bacterium]|nr:cation transporter [Clostridia bacterium]